MELSDIKELRQSTAGKTKPIEMRVEPFIQATFDKYLSDENDEYLFKFHKRYSNPDSFNANVNIGIRKICADMGMKKEDYYCYLLLSDKLD